MQKKKEELLERFDKAVERARKLLAEGYDVKLSTLRETDLISLRADSLQHF